MTTDLIQFVYVDPETAQTYDLALFPWEVGELLVAEAEAVFAEVEAKPGLGLEDLDLSLAEGYDPSLDFEALLSEVQATGGWTGPVALDAYVEENIGEHFARHPWQY